MKDKVNNLFKSYKVIIICLVGICLFVLMYCNNLMKSCSTYLFEGNSEYVEIDGGVIALNYNMNLFQGSNIKYIYDTDIVITSYDIGYYVLVGEEYLPLASMASDDDGEVSLKKLIEGKDNFRVYEFSKSDYYFTDDKIDNINNLYFIIKVKDTKGNEISDVIKLDIIKITK